jgi:hypothetical protein
MTRTIRLLLLLALLGVVVSGCFNRRSKVSGKVTYQGKPVPAGTVTFNAPEGGIYTYVLSTEGTYSGNDLPPAAYVVTIDTEALNPKGHPVKQYGGAKNKTGGDPSMNYEARMKQMGKVPEGATATGEYVQIPEKYRDKKNSPLKESLVSGSNQKNFDLTD